MKILLGQLCNQDKTSFPPLQGNPKDPSEDQDTTSETREDIRHNKQVHRRNCMLSNGPRSSTG